MDYEVVEEPLRQWTKWMQDWSRASGERARVPVLRYWDEHGVEHIQPESNEINFFLDRVDGAPKFTPVAGSASYSEMRAWWEWCDTELKPMIDLYKYGPNREWDKEVNEIHKVELAKLLGELERHLENKTHIVEDRLTLADIAVIPFIRQIMRTREGEFDFTPFPRIVAWANNILETDWFQNEVMKKYPLAEVGV